MDALKGSTGTANLTVSKADPQVTMNDSAITQTYNGSSVTYTPQNVTVTVPNLTISNPKFSVVYKKDGTPLDQPPLLPGTYTTEIQVAEGDTYQAKTIAGPQITIQKATPSIALSHSFAQNGLLPGTYTTEIQVAEGDTYQAKTIAGPQITIQKATPSIALSHSFAQNGNVILQATLQGVENGIVPPKLPFKKQPPASHFPTPSHRMAM